MGICKKIKRKIGAGIYYLVGYNLPPSWSGINIGQTAIRRFCEKLMLESCGKNVNIEKGAVFSQKVKLGDYSGIGINAKIYGACNIGNYVMMGTDVTVITRNHRFEQTDIPMMEQGFEDEDFWEIRSSFISTIVTDLPCSASSYTNATNITNTTNPAPNALSNSLLQAQIAKNLKSRIDELAKKNYQRFRSSNPRFANAKMHEFVLLFVPYQNILDMALEADAYIYQYAYQKGIYLTTPHTLFMALKTISIGWVHIQSDEKVQRAFEEIGRFYDKFASFYEDFERLKKTLKQAQNTSDEMETKINGKGGLSSRAETLKELGAKTKKSLPKIKEAQDEDQDLDKPDKAPAPMAEPGPSISGDGVFSCASR